MLNSSDRQGLRIGAIAAMLGPLVLFVSTLMHPLEADPNDAAAAFTEYAADRLWVGTHLGQFLGVAIIVAALVMLSRSLEGIQSTFVVTFDYSSLVALELLSRHEERLNQGTDSGTSVSPFKPFGSAS